MNNKEFQREDRYVVVKLKKLTHTQERHLRSCLHGEGINTVESVVVEKDWPEYHLVWMMLEHRMAGKPVPDFNLWRRADALQQSLAGAEQRNGELVELLRDIYNQNELSGFDDRRIEAALNPKLDQPLSGK